MKIKIGNITITCTTTTGYLTGTTYYDIVIDKNGQTEKHSYDESICECEAEAIYWSMFYSNLLNEDDKISIGICCFQGAY